jgi:hypothetical protein
VTSGTKPGSYQGPAQLLGRGRRERFQPLRRSVGSRCGGVGASCWGVPGEHSWFWLFQVPAVELFHPVVVST